MATFLDVSGLQHFTSIFVFLFVWIVIYAVLLLTRVMGENKFVHAMVGLLLAVFVLLSPIATSIVADIAPIVAVSFLFVVLLSVASKMLGGDLEAFSSVKGVFMVFLVLTIIIAAGVKIRDNVNVPTETPTDLSKTTNLLFHPAFLGTVLLLAIAVFTIALLATRTA